MPHKNPDERKRYMKEYREKNRQYFRDAHNRWAQANPEKRSERLRVYLSEPSNRKKQRARTAVYYAISVGKLVRPNRCEECKILCKPEADHHDYDKKLDVRWLCKPCHALVTIERKNAIINS